MSIDLTALQRELAEAWDYQDILAVALAKCKADRFVADPERWNRTIFDAKRLIEDENACLLDGIRFNRREPFAPYSEQLEGFFRVMARSGSLSLGNPSYQVYEMKESVKLRILQRERQLLDEYGDQITVLAEMIERHLAVE